MLLVARLCWAVGWLWLCSCGDAYIVNGYGSQMGIDGQFRDKGHSGVDFVGDVGDPAIAAADGAVVARAEAIHGVGRCLMLEHYCAFCKPDVYYTSYCHLEQFLVEVGDTVLRGQRLALIGESGQFSRKVPHLHFTMCNYPCLGAARDGDFKRTLDPMRFSAGCYDSAKTYAESTEPIVTYPIECRQ